MLPMVVRKGINDGIYVEISGDGVKVGDDIIVGIKDVATEENKKPFKSSEK